MAPLARRIHSCCSPCRAPGEEQQRVLLRGLKNDALAELKLKRSLRKTSPPPTLSYSSPLGTTEQNTKMRRRRIRCAEFNLSLFMGIKLFFSPLLDHWNLKSVQPTQHKLNIHSPTTHSVLFRTPPLDTHL